MFRFIFCLLALICFEMAHAKEEVCARGRRHYRTTIRHIESGGIGYNDGYTTLEAFLAPDPYQWSVTPFLDVRGHLFDNGKWATNVGAGVRALWGNRAYGLNTYYDYRHTSRLNANQIGIGLETLGELFDFRINGYLPVGVKTSRPYDTAFGLFLGNYMLVSQKYHSAMKGADAEFGFHFGKSETFDFYAAAGPYYFIGQKAPTTWGGKARLAAIFKETLSFEISDSYDSTFHNKFQGQISLSFSFGPKSKVKERGRSCKLANKLNDRMLQPVGRQEIIVVDKAKKETRAIDPSTGKPYFFVFVDNRSSSDGTYESPYHSLAQAQDNSSPNNIIYLFPGDGTTTGMDAGIILKENQKLWGSGVSHSITTSKGVVSIPAQSSSLPTITNTDMDTEGHAITLASNNAISGIIISSAIVDGIYGSDPQNLEVSSCIFKHIERFPIEGIFSGDATIAVTNNEFLTNTNGVSLTLNGRSTVVCLDNTFKDQSSTSNVPIEISANNNILAVDIENNLFDGNTTGGIRVALNNAINADFTIQNNTMTDNGTGAQASLGSSIVFITNGTTDHFTIALNDNTFSGNTSNSLFFHTDGAITTLDAIVTRNTMSNNGGSALVFATPVDIFRLVATDNNIAQINDNAIAVISSGLSTAGDITLSDNIMTDIGNGSNGIAINQDFAALNLEILNNEIDRCEGTGILSYASTGIDSLALTISGNSVSNCENLSSNAASGIDIEQYGNLAASITNNTLSDNTGLGVAIGSGLTNPSVCLTLTGNSCSSDYSLTNPGGGTFYLTPCDVQTMNTGVINTSGTIELIQSCSNPTPCP